MRIDYRSVFPAAIQAMARPTPMATRRAAAPAAVCRRPRARKKTTWVGPSSGARATCATTARHTRLPTQTEAASSSNVTNAGFVYTSLPSSGPISTGSRSHLLFYYQLEIDSAATARSEK
jgi:hypothetical protein